MGLIDPRTAHWAPETKGLELLDWTLGDLLRDVARRFPQKEAIVYSVYPELDLDVRWTYSALDRKVDELARGLLAIGIKKGDKIAVWSSNIPEWILLMFATARIGAVLVTVNTNSTSRELEYVLKQSDSRALFLMPKYRAMDYIERFEQVVPALSGQRPGRLHVPHLPELSGKVQKFRLREEMSLRQLGGVAQQRLGHAEPDVPVPIIVEIADDASLVVRRKAAVMALAGEGGASFDVRDSRGRHDRSLSDSFAD